MRIRENPLPVPPDRAPYFRVSVAGHALHFRTPSLVELAKLGGVMSRDQLRSVLVVTSAVSGGSALLDALLAARAGASEAFALVGAVVGVAWADPVLELETVRPAEWTPETLAAFGASVFEELHEAGWKLGQVVAAALAVAEQVSELASFESEVQERIRFFLRPKGAGPTTSPRPSASSSEDVSGPSGVES